MFGLGSETGQVSSGQPGQTAQVNQVKLSVGPVRFGRNMACLGWREHLTQLSALVQGIQASMLMLWLCSEIGYVGPGQTLPGPV